MNFKKKNTKILLACLLATLVFSACEKFKGDVEVPAFLHLDRIDIVPQPQNAPSSEPGFYSSIVDAAQLICYFDGDDAETNLGVYQLPFTVPILHHGPVEYIKVVPVIKQNGISGTRISYPFFQTIQIDDVLVAKDSITNFGTLNNGQWTLNAHYIPRRQMDILMEDYFEPTSFSTNFDSCITWVRDEPENACSGQGYGLLEVPDSVTTSTFSINIDLNPKTGQVLYLEMDYQTDLDLYVNMLGFAYSSSGSASSKPIMTLLPNNRWQKIYINLGRTWGQYNYNTPIRLFFQAANPYKTGGKVKIDNVKIVAK